MRGAPWLSFSLGLSLSFFCVACTSEDDKLLDAASEDARVAADASTPKADAGWTRPEDAGVEAGFGIGVDASATDSAAAGAGAGAAFVGDASFALGSGAGTVAAPSQDDAGVDDEDAATPEYVSRKRGSLMVEGTEGFLRLSVESSFSGTARRWKIFSAEAQLFSDISGGSSEYVEEIEPLVGLDDCGIDRPSGAGTSGDESWTTAESMSLIDGDDVLPFEDASLGGTVKRYLLDLTGMKVAPRYGGEYGYRASGKKLVGPIAIDGIRLPAKLSMTEWESDPLLARDGTLHWTGADGSGVLEITISLRTDLGSFRNAYQIHCMLIDDGEYTFPAHYLDAMPNGYATVYVRRDNRYIAKRDKRKLVVSANVTSEYSMAFGDRCDRTAERTACLAYIAKHNAEAAECGADHEMLSPEVGCPDLLDVACKPCTEYYDCLKDGVECMDGELWGAGNCTCHGYDPTW